MLSKPVFKVLLSVYYFLTIVTATNFDFKSNVLVRPSNLIPLKDVKVWKNNPSASITLQDILGSDIDKWRVDEYNSKVVADVTFTALCCSYSTNMMDFLHIIYETIFEEYENNEKELSVKSTISILSKMKTHFLKYNDTVLDYLTTVHHYSIQLEIDMDKNFISSVLAISEFVHNYYMAIGPDGVTADNIPNLNSNKIETLKRNLHYIKHTIELYNIENCALPEISGFEITKKLKHKWNGKEVKGNSTTANFMLHVLEEFLLNTVWCPYDLLLTELVDFYKSFSTKDFLRSSMLEIQLISGNEMTRLKHLKVNTSSDSKTLQQVHKYVSSDFHLEKRFIYHAFIKESIGVIVLYIVSAMIRNDDIPTADTDFGVDNTSIVSALNFLDGLHPTSLLRTVLKQLRYSKMFGSDKKYILMAIDKYFDKSTIKWNDVAMFVQCTFDGIATINVQQYNSSELANMLDHFVKQVETLENHFFAKVIIQNTPNESFYAPLLLLDAKTIVNEDTQINYPRFITDNCDMASDVMKLFILIDILVSEFERSVNDLKNVKNFQVLIGDYFDKMKMYVTGIEYKLKQLFVRIIKPVTINMTFVPINRKVLESMYIVSLYLNNEPLYKVPVTADDVSYFKTVAAKFEALKRAHLNIINYLEHYMNDHCSFLSPREEYIKHLLGDLNNFCQTSTGDNLNFDCIGYKLKLAADATAMPDFQTRLENRFDGYIYYFDDDYNVVHVTSDEEYNATNTNTDYERSMRTDVAAANLNKCSVTDQFCATEGDDKDSSDIEDIYYLYSKFFEPSYFLFGSETQMTVNDDEEFVALNNLQVRWHGKIIPIPRLYDIVKTHIDFKYVCEYQLLILKVIVYISFDKIKDVLMAMKSASIVEAHTVTITNALNFISPLIIPSHIWVIEQITDVLHNENSDFDRHRAIEMLVEILEQEQISLDITFRQTGPSMYSSTLDHFIERLDEYSEELQSINDNIEHIMTLMEWKNIVDVTIT